jgi:hypothetical protein
MCVVPIGAMFIGYICQRFSPLTPNYTCQGLPPLHSLPLKSLFEFGYFRKYEAFLHRYPESFFADEVIIQNECLISPDFRAILYLEFYM